MGSATITTKPALMKLETNVAPAESLRSSYPSELSALSEGTPISAHPLSVQASAPFTAPIVPPLAYTDFLKSMLGSPTIAAPRMPLISRAQSASTTVTTPTSPPSTASSASTRTSFKSEHKRAHDDDGDDEEERGGDDEDEDMSTSDSDDDDDDIDDDDDDSETEKRGSRTTPTPLAEDVSAPATPQPKSAPPRPTSFPSLSIPPSPSYSTLGGSPMASPYSATFSATSPNFPPYSIEMANIRAKWDISGRNPSKTVRYRSVVTRTITYAPKINAVPKNKRRRVD